LPSLINRLDRLREQNSLYGEILKSLMRFGVIEGILSDQDKEKKLVAYYEAIRAAGVGLGNPQFWLQYAIACMSFRDYDVADAHFRTAFGLADKRGGYDPYQIENQYARFLVESRTQSNKWNDAYESLRKANEIVSRQMSSFTEGYYPYRVARNYLAFVEANDKILSKEEKGRIAEWCAHLLVLSENAPDFIKGTAYWRQAQESLKHTIDYVTA
jgi:tetratricopeptide (TPR) repeat protein